MKLKLLILAFFLFLLSWSSLANPKMAAQIYTATTAVSEAGLAPQAAHCPCLDEPANTYGTDPKYRYSLKAYPTPSRGCIPVSSVDSDEANRLIASQGFHTVGATDREKRTLGAAIKRVQQLAGGVLEQGRWFNSDSFPWEFVDRSFDGYSTYCQLCDLNGRTGEFFIEISRKKSERGDNHYGHSVGQHIHEWAHLIGNRGAYQEFQNFMNARNYGADDYCKVSGYADNSDGEQFAEVFTAFVTEPSLLLNNSSTPSNCRKVFDFFYNWFDQGEAVESCL